MRRSGTVHIFAVKQTIAQVPVHLPQLLIKMNKFKYINLRFGMISCLSRPRSTCLLQQTLILTPHGSAWTPRRWRHLRPLPLRWGSTWQRWWSSLLKTDNWAWNLRNPQALQVGVGGGIIKRVKANCCWIVCVDFTWNCSLDPYIKDLKNLNC